MNLRAPAGARSIRGLAARMLAGAALLGAVPAAAQPARELSRESCADRLRAMWLGECIANWTGLRTEGRVVAPPFLTDEDWGTDIGKGVIDFVTDQDPWLADDDTDIEYVYIHLLAQHATNAPTPEQLAAGWIAHINRYIWVSNEEARRLMGRGVLPWSTGMGAANLYWLKIDAQLTTEVFGAICPGMPEEALRLADTPIRTTSAGYASHAAQAYVVMYALAAVAPEDLAPRARCEWLVEQARRWLPDESKSADIIDHVLADYRANPDRDDWERTRDLIYDRYQLHAAENGFDYRAWTESSVNFATGVMALLYGGGDFRRTVQIGTLSGWDSDNGTATMGGLLGLMLGTEALLAQFPGEALSDRYNAARTRDALPDHLPLDPDAEDTFSLLAQRMLPMVERAILERGGLVDAPAGRWLLPPSVGGAPRGGTGLTDVTPWNPLRAELDRSANNRVRLEGGTVTASASVASAPPGGYGFKQPAHFANGFEQDFRGIEPSNTLRRFYSSQNSALSEGDTITLTVEYDRPVEVAAVRFIEGDHFDDPAARGGYFLDAGVLVRVGGNWIEPPGGVVPSAGLDPARPFQVVDFALNQPLEATGVRLVGRVGGADGFVTCAELDALAPRVPPDAPGFDLNADGVLDYADLASHALLPADLDGDGDTDGADTAYLVRAIRWGLSRPGPGLFVPPR